MGRIWPVELDCVEGVQVSSVESGTNFGTKFVVVRGSYGPWLLTPPAVADVSDEEGRWRLVGDCSESEIAG